MRREAVGGSEGTREALVLRRLAIGRFSDSVVARLGGLEAPEVILKRVRARGSDAAAFESAMTRAGVAYARLADGSIARLLEFFPSDDRFVLVREHVDGLPLRRVTALLREAGERLEARVALYIGVRVFKALAAAHAQGVVHGAVHPGNVLVSWNGQVQVSDFAIGHAARGFAHPASERADVYAASLVVWEMLTGQRAGDVKASAEDLRGVEMDAAVREAIGYGLADGERGLSAALMSRALRDPVNDDLAHALLVMALEAVRPAPESEPISSRDGAPASSRCQDTHDTRDAREDREERSSTAVAAMYAMVSPEARRKVRTAAARPR